MYDRAAIREGMTVHARDGEKLGKVIAIGQDQFQIEKGIFFPKEYLADYSAISEIRDDSIILSQGAEALRKPGEAVASTSMGAERSVMGERGAEGARMRLAEEELEVTKRQADAGEVVVTKEVVQEQKTVTVPVERERVRVERVPVSGSASATDARFEGESVSIPLKQEEVEVRKRPVVREEVRVAKDTEVEQRSISDTVRREEAHIRSEGDVEGPISERGEPLDDPLKRG
jgi:uncharacterized protein (TIGR02271 family)